MIRVTAVHLEGGEAHEHIERVQWVNPSSGATGVSTRESMVDWITDGGDARVGDGDREVKVLVVKATPPYIRTYADGQWTNNLLALPRF